MQLDRIVCLANSYKHENRCVAGIGLSSRRWVRLVADKASGSIARERTCFSDGSEAAILDVFEAEIAEPCGSQVHPEDVLVTDLKWKKIRRFDQPEDLELLATQVNNGPEILGGCGDRACSGREHPASITSSLELVHPEDLWWWVREEKGKRRNRALFRVGNAGRVRYDLAVTDPRWLESLQFLTAGIYPHSYFFRGTVPPTYLTISLSEAYENFHYKLVAGVIVA